MGWVGRSLTGAGLAVTLMSCAAGSGTRPGGEGGGAEPQGAPELAWVVFGGDTVVVEVSRTSATRERGLMLRDSVPDGTGMLFVFPDVEVQGVWMKDTLVPLDAAFMDEDFRITGIEALEPQDLTVRYSEEPVAYVLEVPRGWLAAHGVDVGDRAEVVFGVDGP